MFRDRVVEFRRVRADTLRPNPRNWRGHPPAQVSALRAALDEVGFVGALVARPLADGSLELVDGHLRAETLPTAELPVLVVDLSDDEADKLLAVYDPIAALASTHRERLASLLADIELRHESLRSVVDEVLERHSQRSLDDLLARRETDIDHAPHDPDANQNAAVEASSSSRADKCSSRAARDKTFRATYQLVVDCRSESEQRELYERLTAEGHQCRVLTLS
ncbi:MAG: ParB N-terminal domain-containing protein [Pirellulales bacterium]